MATKFILPLEFGRVSSGIYRSAYPAAKCLSYIKTLGLRSMICLQPSDLRDELRQFCQEHSISLLEVDVGINQEPFVSMNHKVVQEAIQAMTDVTLHPCLVFCSTGKNRTGCIIGCFRKVSGWSHASTTLEYEQFTGPDSSPLDIQFIESFI